MKGDVINFFEMKYINQIEYLIRQF